MLEELRSRTDRVCATTTTTTTTNNNNNNNKLIRIASVCQLTVVLNLLVEAIEDAIFQQFKNNFRKIWFFAKVAITFY